MSANSISPPYPIFTDVDGNPLNDGYVYIGAVNQNPETHPIPVFWDAELTIPAAQPIRTNGGYPVRNGTPARMFVNSEYSITIRNKNGSFVYSSLVPTDVVGADVIKFIQNGTGAVQRSVQSKLRDIVNVRDFGAVGNGIHDDTAAIQAALDYAGSINAAIDSNFGTTVYVPSGQYIVKKPLAITLGTTIQGDRSGLVGILPNKSTGTVFQVSATKADGSRWSESVLNGGNIVAGRVLFYMNGGGGVASLQDFGAIPELTYANDAVFFQTGGQAVPYEQSGLSQGFFVGIRPTSFYTVFRGGRVSDCNFVNCGFEFNIVFASITPLLTGTAGVFAGNRFVNCVFFGSYSHFQIGKAEMVECTFSNCNFDASPGVETSTIFEINSNDAVFKNNMFSSCTSNLSYASVGNKDFLRVVAASPTIDGISFSSCAFISSSFDINYISPAGSLRGLSFSSCAFTDSKISVQYEVNDLLLSANTFIGNSYINLVQPQGMVVQGNSFLQVTQTTQTEDLIIDAGATNFTVIGNLFRSGHAVNVHPASTNYKVYNNINQADLHNP